MRAAPGPDGTVAGQHAGVPPSTLPEPEPCPPAATSRTPLCPRPGHPDGQALPPRGALHLQLRESTWGALLGPHSPVPLPWGIPDAPPPRTASHPATHVPRTVHVHLPPQRPWALSYLFPHSQNTPDTPRLSQPARTETDPVLGAPPPSLASCRGCPRWRRGCTPKLRRSPVWPSPPRPAPRPPPGEGATYPPGAWHDAPEQSSWERRARDQLSTVEPGGSAGLDPLSANTPLPSAAPPAHPF